jgi:CheY-like chemotaxis protein
MGWGGAPSSPFVFPERWENRALGSWLLALGGEKRSLHQEPRAKSQERVQPAAASILIIDDDEDMRVSLAEILQDEGYQVAGVANGREALERLREMEPPCLILLDLMMPVMSGWEFREQQRRDPQLAQIPVVILTGVRNTLDQVSAMEPVGYFQKPVDLPALLATVAQFC